MRYNCCRYFLYLIKLGIPWSTAEIVRLLILSEKIMSALIDGCVSREMHGSIDAWLVGFILIHCRFCSSFTNHKRTASYGGP